MNPYLEAVIETNPDALAIARSLDDERKDGKVRGPLHAVPVLVKDVGVSYLRTLRFLPLHKRQRPLPYVYLSFTYYHVYPQNMATADKQQTTAGSWALLGSIVPKDAHIVKLLREAGAVILGKSNLDECKQNL